MAPDLAALSARERDVLGLLAEGLTNGGIADRLQLSPRTVDTHVSMIFAKLHLGHAPHLNRRVRAAAIWYTAHE